MIQNVFFQKLCRVIVPGVFSLLLITCSTVPITGRKQLSLIPGSTMLSMSAQQYGEFLKTNKLAADQQQLALVKRVGQGIQHAVEEYFRQKNLSDQLKGYN